MRATGLLSGVLAGALVLGTPWARAADTVIVYDASNSMWGQIDGEAKISIARRLMADLLRDWDENTRIGLVAYGHRRAGDCGDIETVTPVGPVDREALTARVEGLQPRGKTPLTAAVRHAAEELKYRDQPASVVLISDGIESCKADPCAVAEELEQAGLRFTAHVVGFDVTDAADQEQLSCIAENTGGRFFPARDAEGLRTALAEVREIAAEPDLPEPEVSLTVPEQAVAGSEVTIGWTAEQHQPEDLVTIVPVDAAPTARGSHQRVRDARQAVLTAPGESGRYQVRYLSAASGRVAASAPIELTEPRVQVSAPEQVSGGAEFTASWEHPVHPRDYITIVPADTPANEHGRYIRVRAADSGALTAPAEPGDYEVRYHLHASGKAVASTPVEVVGEAVSLNAPETVTGGTVFTVRWDNAVNPRDFVTIVPIDSPDAEYGSYARVREDTETTLTAPAEPGRYEVRYMLQADKRVLARVAVEVQAAEAQLEVPAEVTAGADFPVRWETPVNPRDYVTVVPVDTPDGKHDAYIRVRDDSAGSLTAPAEPGAYEVRYMLHKDKRVLARATLQVRAARAEVEAPAEVMAGADFTVRWDVSVHPRDYVTIVPAGTPDGKHEGYVQVRDDREGSLTAPAEPGAYEVRYMLRQGRRVLSRVPVEVLPAEVVLEGPETVAAGETFTVRWNPPVNREDYVTIVPVGTPEGKHAAYVRVGSRAEGQLTAPEQPGEYELRYILRAGRNTVARLPVRVLD